MVCIVIIVRGIGGSGRSVQRLEGNIILLENILIMANATQQLPLRESATPLVSCRLYTWHAYPGAVSAGKCTTAFTRRCLHRVHASTLGGLI